MKITVTTRQQTCSKPSQFLEFTIRCEEPHNINFREIDGEMMNMMRNFRLEFDSKFSADEAMKDFTKSTLINIEGRFYDKMKAKLTEEIHEKVEEKIYAICQEIYNWLYDNQNGDFKEWMEEFDAKRTRYYFDNHKGKYDQDMD